MCPPPDQLEAPATNGTNGHANGTNGTNGGE